jgi:hypothetical protein
VPPHAASVDLEGVAGADSQQGVRLVGGG